VLVLFDVVIEVPDVEQKRRTLAIVQIRQDAVLDEPPQLPFAHAGIFSGLSGADQAETRDRGSVHERLAFGGNSGSRTPDEGQIITILTRFQHTI
jgi:hypothetical protein